MLAGDSPGGGKRLGILGIRREHPHPVIQTD